MHLFEPVGAVQPRADLGLLAHTLPPSLILGTSSWSFPGWSGVVYDRPYSESLLAREGLRAYARHPLLRGVGIDRTFYRPIGASDFARYREQVGTGFRFLVKAHDQLCLARFPSHPRYGERAGMSNPHFLDAELAVRTVVKPAVEGLGEALGVLLFQFPPQSVDAMGGVDGFADRLGRFLGALPPGVPYAVEVRNERLLSRRYADVLVASGARHSYVAMTRMPPIREQMRRVPGGARHGLVVRWMLGHGLDYETAKARYAPFHDLAAPAPGVLGDIAYLVGLALRRELGATVIVNNKAEGCAPRSVIRLAEAVAASL